MSEPFALAGKHALVTGAGGPLARTLAVALAEGGVTVSVTTLTDDRDQEVEAQSILNECWSLGHDGRARRLDLTDPAAVDAAVDSLEAELGPISVLVSAYQTSPSTPAATATLEAWQAELACNATSVIVPALVIGRRMHNRRSGRIVHIVSAAHAGGEAGTALFAAAQGAVLAFTRTLAAEWDAADVAVRALVVEETEAEAGPHAHPRLRAAVRDLVTAPREAEAMVVLRR